MTAALSQNAFMTFKNAVARAFPERKDVATLRFDGDRTQAWEAYSRLLSVNIGELKKRLAKVYGVDVAESVLDAQADALERVPSGFCQTHLVLPLRQDKHQLVIATADPTDSELTELVRFMVGQPICWVLASPQEIDLGILSNFSKKAAHDAEAELNAANKEGENDPVVKLANSLLRTSFEQRASDLHIQPFLGNAVARIRVDGVLRKLTMLSDAVAVSLMRYFKARSSMDSTNTLIPQDGRMSMVVGERDVDMRVSTLPASRGERLAIRFLDQGKTHRLNNANFSLAALQTIRRTIARPSGLVIMTGPTGSGKTSTLYAMLAELNQMGVNIITVENPVEYRMAGISQVDVNEKAGRTFSAALRSILRQDPDIVLIGEIRDAETAQIAVQAALTGHLVLSTLHTNDAITAIPRLINLGLQPTILADSLAAVIAQRLCRTLCPACKVLVSEPLTPVEKQFVAITRNLPGYRAVGCKACDFTGYRGRLPIVDIVEMNKRLRDAVAGGESRLEILEGLRRGGLKSLAASGSVRVISGDTTVQEVMSAVGPVFWSELAAHYGTSANIADLDDLDLVPEFVSPGMAVLLMSPEPGQTELLEEAIHSEGLSLIVSTSAEEAHGILQKNENIAFIIGDVPSGASPQAAIDLLRNNRLHISWARLPSIVLMPPELADQQDVLRESGVMAAFVIKPVKPADLIAQIKRAQAR